MPNPFRSENLISIYRAMPLFTNEIRKGDYVTPSRKFAKDHAVTSAIYHDEPFHVVMAKSKPVRLG